MAIFWSFMYVAVLVQVVAGAGTLQPRGRGSDKCLRALRNEKVSQVAFSFCTSWLATAVPVTATPLLPKYARNCMAPSLVPQLSNACSCLLEEKTRASYSTSTTSCTPEVSTTSLPPCPPEITTVSVFPTACPSVSTSQASCSNPHPSGWTATITVTDFPSISPSCQTLVSMVTVFSTVSPTPPGSTSPSTPTSCPEVSTITVISTTCPSISTSQVTPSSSLPTSGTTTITVHSSTSTLPTTAPSPSCNVIMNSGFERGNISSWIQAADVEGTYPSGTIVEIVDAFEGRFAWMGQRRFSIQQVLQFPLCANPAKRSTLSIWWKPISTPETGSCSIYACYSSQDPLYSGMRCDQSPPTSQIAVWRENRFLIPYSDERYLGTYSIRFGIGCKQPQMLLPA
jgi:hypothetical protein